MYSGGKIHCRDKTCGGSGGNWIVTTQIIPGSEGPEKAGRKQVLPYHQVREINRGTFEVLMGRGMIIPAIVAVAETNIRPNHAYLSGSVYVGYRYCP